MKEHNNPKGEYPISPKMRTLSTAGITALAAVTILGSCAKADLTRPNIILVMADDMGWGDVAYNGNDIVKTPCLDKMSAEAVRMDRFYAAAPVCSPTRGSCLTGRHPFRYNMPWAGDGHLPSEEITIAEVLREQGYATGHFGKWHVGQLSKTVKQTYFPGDKANPEEYSPPWENGFDVCFSTESMVPTYNPYFHDCGEFSVREGDSPYLFIMDKAVKKGDRSGVRWRDYYWRGEGQIVDENLPGDDSALVVDEAEKFILNQKKSGNPFLALVWFHTPHTPVVAGNEDRALYPGLSIEQQHWFGALSAMDRQVGRIRDMLKKNNLSDNTILWFCSDNGPSYIHDYNSAGPFSGKKATLLEGGLRVPAIIEWPAKLKQAVITEAVTTSDIYPTLLSLMGIAVDAQPVLDGEPVFDILMGECSTRSRGIGFQSPVKNDKNPLALKGSLSMVWMDGNYKLSSFDNGEHWQLFNLGNDPAEKNNILNQNKEKAEAMKATLLEWQSSCANSAKGNDY